MKLSSAPLLILTRMADAPNIFGKQYILTSWWVTVEPGIAIFITLFSLNLLGDSLQKYIDPRLR